MSKVVLLLAVASAAAVVAAQGYPNTFNEIPNAIQRRDWDRLSQLVGVVYNREFGNRLNPGQGYNTFTAPRGQQPLVQTFAGPLGQRSVIQAFGASQPGPGPHTFGSAVNSFVSTRTGPDGVTTVQRGGDGLIQQDGQVTHFNTA